MTGRKSCQARSHGSHFEYSELESRARMCAASLFVCKTNLTSPETNQKTNSSRRENDQPSNSLCGTRINLIVAQVVIHANFAMLSRTSVKSDDERRAKEMPATTYLHLFRVCRQLAGLKVNLDDDIIV